MRVARVARVACPLLFMHPCKSVIVSSSLLTGLCLAKIVWTASKHVLAYGLLQVYVIQVHALCRLMTRWKI